MSISKLTTEKKSRYLRERIFAVSHRVLKDTFFSFSAAKVGIFYLGFNVNFDEYFS